MIAKFGQAALVDSGLEKRHLIVTKFLLTFFMAEPYKHSPDGRCVG